MDLHDILGRIDQRLAVRELSATAASERAGSKDLIRNWRRAVKDRKPAGATMTSLGKLAPVLGTSVSWLATGEGDPDQPDVGRAAIPVPLISWVSASGLELAEHVAEIGDARTVYAPALDPDGDWFALEVKGSSMDRISPPESIIFVNRLDRRLVANACYIIAEGDSGEASYKRYRPAPERWEPVSTLDHETLYPTPGNTPRVIGRVRLSMLAM